MQKFINELLIRFFTEKPQFFKIIQIIGIIAAMITGLPELIDQYCFEIPEGFELMTSKTIAVASLVATFVAQLTTTTKEKKKEGLED